ncbi:putative nuclease HARBI1 [Clytia hemisphaerica]|uniref:putative nuclease HARBI1 n=1 Tax=Clytia hemisphaerica TaxID=252671 RepID=UPI0034D644B7
MPHTIGCIDGKHIRIECPRLTGSQYYNYKGFFSIVLMAVCDANYCFTLVDLGQYGSNNDSGVLSSSLMGEMFDGAEMNLPDPSKIHPSSEENVPYFLLGDEIFPLKSWLMRPYPGAGASEEERIYNYRHSRGRRCIENAFGILSQRWRIFLRPIKASVKNVESYTLACLSLHNYLRLTNNAGYVPAGFADSEDSSGNIVDGTWRNGVEGENGALRNLTTLHGSRFTKTALEIREKLKTHVNSEEGSVPWQVAYVRRTSHYAV